MKLRVKMIDGFDYRVGMREFPLVIQISTDETVELAEKIDVLGLSLELIVNQDIFFGGTSCILAYPRTTFVLAPGEFHEILVDVLKGEYDDDDPVDEEPEALIGMVAGEYRLQVDVRVYRKTAGQGFELINLSVVENVSIPD